MSCPFYQTTLLTRRLPISAIYDFDDAGSSILLQGDEKDKRQVGNPIVPGSELPPNESDEDEQRRDEQKEKPNL